MTDCDNIEPKYTSEQMNDDTDTDSYEDIDYDINEVREFFAKHSSPEWKTFVTCSRCDGFTLSYGMFFRLDETRMDRMVDDNEDTKKLSIIDECKQLRQMLSNPDANYVSSVCEYWQRQYPELVFYSLPCCWSSETKLDFFVGFNIYPLLWTRRRHFIGDHCLLSVHDDFFSSKEEKDKNLQKYEKYELYKAPAFLETEYIFDTYCNMDTWKNSLYLKNYNRISHWIPMLNELYKDIIVSKTNILHNFFSEKKHFLAENETRISNYEWCFLPSDCASCS